MQTSQTPRLPTAAGTCLLILATLAAAAAAQQHPPPPDSSDVARSGAPRSGRLAARSGTRAGDSAAGGPRAITAVRIRGSGPSLDGRLDENAWERAAVATGFVQLEPDEGKPASEPTEARILYGSDALYVGFRAYDSEPDRIAGQLTRRDQDSYSDRVFVAVDSYFDRRTAFIFAVNPAGVKTDVYMFEDGEEDDSWDAVWEVATSVDRAGWTAEFRIPYSQLRFDGAEVQTWGLNLAREIARLDEQSFWAPLTRTGAGIVSRFGLLRGLRDIESPNRMEVEPFTVARLERSPDDADDPARRPTRASATAGADVKYGVTDNLTLNLTLNPDFGQVEADPAEVNLTAFETFFPEKRPFFLENRNIFDVRIGLGDGGGAEEALFYSRRVGRPPQGGPGGPGGRADVPDHTTILGAWKLSGKTASGWTVGALHAVTAREEARVAAGAGPRRTGPAEPLTSYGMMRLQKDFRDGWSAAGLVGTAVNRAADAADELELRRAAYAGGFDFRHRFGAEGDYRVRGRLLGSSVTGSAAALERTQRSSARYFQRPDADHLGLDPTRTRLDGWAGTLEVAKRGGGFWRSAAMLQARSPGFEVNDVGFQRSADRVTTVAFVGYHHSEPGERFRRWNLNANAWREQTFGGEETGSGGNVNGSFTLNNLWGGHGGVGRELGAYSTTLLRGGPAIRTAAGWSAWGGLSTDRRKALQVRLNGNGNVWPARDSWRYRVGSDARWRPSTSVSLSLGPFVERRTEDRQWVGTVDAGGRRYLFGRLDQTTAGLTARLETAFTPTLSLQVYAQPFVSAGDYREFKEVADPRAPRYEDRFRRLAVSAADDGYEVDLDGDGTPERFREPDFDALRFRSNAVLRWQYRPGSTLYLVWSQARSRSDAGGDFDLASDLEELFSVRPRNVFLVKISYWLTP